jgi:predicted enzyme related to lactoylglutathione lyase
MIANRSVPTTNVLPHLVYRDVEAAVAWLGKAFGFREHYRYGDPAAISGAQLFLGSAYVMVRRARPGSQSPAQAGCETQSLTVFVDDVEGHFKKAKVAGAKILEEPHETEYGEFQFAAQDLEGHHWLFSRHAKDVSPEQWGATVTDRPPHRFALLARPRVCYLQIPATEPMQSAAFYEKVFGWNIRHRGTSQPAFDDATGDVSGSWFTNLKTWREPGLIVSIWVDDIEATLRQVKACGGTVLEGPQPDSPGSTSMIATFLDPAGNPIGLYQENFG